MKVFLLICFCCAFQQHILSQSNLVRSTTGAAGSSNIITNGSDSYIIQQSIGQPSLIGNINNGNYVVRQGFIQPDVFSKVVEKNISLILQLTIYPNPFYEQISLGFNEKIDGEINITLFNLIGSKVFARSYTANQKIDVILDKLSSGEYIIRAIANHKQFISKILKK